MFIGSIFVEQDNGRYYRRESIDIETDDTVEALTKILDLCYDATGARISGTMRVGRDGDEITQDVDRGYVNVHRFHACEFCGHDAHLLLVHGVNKDDGSDVDGYVCPSCLDRHVLTTGRTRLHDMAAQKTRLPAY